MSKKNQNNDGRDESLTDEQNDISNKDSALEDDHSSDDTINTVEEIEEIYEEIADESDNDVEDEVTDQGFEQQPVTPMAENSSSGNGMAGTAMGLSLLALAGTGYNLYNSNSSGSADSDGSEQAAVDYSTEITSIQEQIDSLMQNQEELTAMATSTDQESSEVAVEAEAEAETETEQADAADESVSGDQNTVETTDEITDETTEQVADTSTSDVDETTQADSTESSSEQDAASSDDADASDTEIADTAATGTESTDTETTDTETTDTEATDTEVADTETTDTDAEATDTEVAGTEETDTEEATSTEMADSETTDAGAEETQASSAETESSTAQAGTEQSDSELTAETDSEGDNQADSDVAAAYELQLQQIQQAQADALASLPSGDEIKNMALEQVKVVIDDANKRLGLNEVAQLLSIGEQRLALASDVGGAQAAFSMADQRLAEFSDPSVEPVRELISSNLAALESLEVVDKNALTQELTGISGSIDTLAFKPLETLSDSASDEQGTESSADEATQDSGESSTSETQAGDESLSLEGAGNWLKSIGSKVGNTIGDVGSGIAGDLKGMVTIAKTGPLADVVLAPEQQYFIRENIKLQLGSAQRAVLQDNSGVYKQSLTQAQVFLNDFFDTENDDVKSVSSKLQDLEQINLDVEMPDVSAASASLADVLKQLPAVGSSETNSN